MSDIHISILMEDQAKMGFLNRKFLAQHGFSVFIEADTNVLFDAGPTDSFMKNATLLGIDLKKTDCVALSHGHWDHTDGLAALQLNRLKRTLVAHPDIFSERHKATGEYNGTALDQKDLTDSFDVILTREPFSISDKITFLGEIPRVNDFEAQKTPFSQIIAGQSQEDWVMDDTALAIDTARGLVIVTGCAHAGICNIVEHAKAVCDEEKVHMVLGGFHLLAGDDQLGKTVDYFSKNPVDRLYPMHCTDLAALCTFHSYFGITKLCAGDTLLL